MENVASLNEMGGAPAEVNAGPSVNVESPSHNS